MSEIKFTVGTKLHDFVVTCIRTAEELHAPLAEMVHERTWAQLCWFEGKEANKLFP